MFCFLLALGEIIDWIVSFAGPISFLRLCNTSKQGISIYTNISDTVKETWMLVCHDVHPDNMNNDTWWIFASGLILQLENKTNDLWKEDEMHMIQSLLAGIWKCWHKSMEGILVKILRDVNPPKGILGKVLMQIWCDMCNFRLDLKERKYMFQHLIKENPEVSTPDALEVYGAQAHTCCSGLYVNRENKDYPELHIYDLWECFWTPSRCLIFY